MKRILLSLILIILLAACALSKPAPTETATTTNSTTNAQSLTSTPTMTSTTTREPIFTPTASTSSITPTLIFPEVEIYLLGFLSSDERAVYQINFPCSDENFQCEDDLVNLFTRNDLNAWEFVISPDGTRMVFLSDYLTEFGISDIFLFTFEDQNLTRLTDSQEYEYKLSWSPSGDLIAYTVEDDQSEWIQIITDSGNHYLTIPTTHIDTFSPVWSNDGKMIAYYAHDVASINLYYYDFESRQSLPLPTLGLQTVYEVVWSPDDSKIAFIGGHSSAPDICIVEIESKDNYCLTDSNYWETHPAWSPDGERIAYSVLDRSAGLSAIWVMNSDGTEKSLVSEEDSVYFRPRWLLDSNLIVCDKQIQDVWQPVILSVLDDTEIRLAETKFGLGWEWVSSE